MKYKYSILLRTVCAVLGACNSYDFDQEQYRKEINLLQNTEGVFDRQVVDMADETSEKGAIINIVAGLSGSRPSNQAYSVSLINSDSLFNAYNKSNFDIETERYARRLPVECYEEPELRQDIPAGKSQVLFPFRLKNLSKLSPDSVYMLNYEIDKDTETPYNPKKRHVLLRIHWKNDYASTARQMAYSYNSAKVITPATTPTGTATLRRPTNSLTAFPLTKNSVRFLAGDEEYGDYKKALRQINQKSIIIEVGEQLPENPLARYITIKPYKEEEMEVKMMTPLGEYDNTFLLNEMQVLGGGNSKFYKEFRVHYKYRLLKVKQNDGSFAPGPMKTVQAKLRYEFNPRADQL